MSLCALVGGRPRRGSEIRFGDAPAGLPVDQHRLGLGAGLAVDDHDALALGREMPVAPGEQRQQYRAKVSAALGQPVFPAGRMLAVALALEQPALDQRVEAPGQHVGRDVEALLKLVEAGQPLQRVAEDQDAPPFAHPLEAAGDRALHVAKARALHDRPVY
jgi:hypothetical protein